MRSADMLHSAGRHPPAAGAELKILIFGVGGSSIRPLGTITVFHRVSNRRDEAECQKLHVVHDHNVRDASTNTSISLDTSLSVPIQSVSSTSKFTQPMLPPGAAEVNNRRRETSSQGRHPRPRTESGAIASCQRRGSGNGQNHRRERPGYRPGHTGGRGTLRLPSGVQWKIEWS